MELLLKIACLALVCWRCLAYVGSICPTPPPLANGQFIAHSLLPGGYVEYTCDECTTMKGHGNITCLPTGEWAHQPPSCEAHVCPGLAVGNSAPIIGATRGYVFTHSCGRDSTTITSRLECQCDGTWAGDMDDCGDSRVNCPQPQAIENGGYKVTSLVPGSFANYSCSECSVMDGTAAILCLDTGSWSMTPPTCKLRTCPSMPRPGGSTIEGATPGFVFAYSCSRNSMTISSRIECKCDGTWDGVLDDCSHIKTGAPPTSNPAVGCGMPPDLANSYKRVFRRRSSTQVDYFMPGDRIQYECQPNYRMSGRRSIIICQPNMKWSDMSMKCDVSNCPDINVPANGQRVGSNAVGKDLRFDCNLGYVLVGVKQVSCQADGTWNSPPPVCRSTCETHKCGVGEKCVADLTTGLPSCTCKTVLECPALFAPVCGSNAESFNNECLMASAACRKQEVILKVKDGICRPGGICHIQPFGKCKGLFDVYMLSPETRQCVRVTVGGCHRLWNGFSRASECQEECEAPLCEAPFEKGPCTRLQYRWGYSSQSRRCQQFLYGGCYGNQNNFESETECLAFCARSK